MRFKLQICKKKILNIWDYSCKFPRKHFWIYKIKVGNLQGKKCWISKNEIHTFETSPRNSQVFEDNLTNWQWKTKFQNYFKTLLFDPQWWRVLISHPLLDWCAEHNKTLDLGRSYPGEREVGVSPHISPYPALSPICNGWGRIRVQIYSSSSRRFPPTSVPPSSSEASTA